MSTTPSNSAPFDATSTSVDISYVKTQCDNAGNVALSTTDAATLCCRANPSIELCVGFTQSIAPFSVENAWVASSLSATGRGGTPLPTFDLAPWRALAFNHINVRAVDVGGVLTESSVNYAALTSLNVVGCQLKSLDVPSPSKLQRVDLSMNSMTTFPGSLFQAPSLVAVNLTGNAFQTAIVVAQACTALQSSANVIVGAAVQCPQVCTAVTTCTVASDQPYSPPTTSPSATTAASDSGSSSVLVVVAAAILLLAVGAVMFCRRRMLLRQQQQRQRSFHRHHSRSTGGDVPIESALFTLTRAPSLSRHGSDSSFVLLDTNRPDIVLLDHISSPMTQTHQVDEDVTILASTRRLSRAFSQSFLQREGESMRHLPPRLAASPPASQPVVQVAAAVAILPASDVTMVSPIAHGSSMWHVKMLNRPYVGKRVRPIEMGAADMNQFIRDLNTAATDLVHPNIVALHGIVHLPDNDLCVVAEWMERGSLGLLLRHQTPTPPRPFVLHLSWPDKLQLAWEVASALACVHSQPNFRRPAPWTTRSVLVNIHGHAKLNVFDFVAGACAEPAFGHQVFAYEAPEVVAHNCTRSSASDIYTLGVVLGEIATRCEPYQHWIDAHGHVGSDVRILASVGASDATAPHGQALKAMDIPAAYQALVATCLHRDVLKRPLAVNVADNLARLILEIQMP